MWVGAHATMAGRGKRSEFLPEFAVFIEQLMRPVTLHPFFELPNVLGVGEVRKRHLVCPPCPFHRFAIYKFWSRPALRRTENDHGPARPIRPTRLPGAACGLLDVADLGKRLIKCSGELPMNLGRIVAFD